MRAQNQLHLLPPAASNKYAPESTSSTSSKPSLYTFWCLSWINSSSPCSLNSSLHLAHQLLVHLFQLAKDSPSLLIPLLVKLERVDLALRPD